MHFWDRFKVFLQILLQKTLVPISIQEYKNISWYGTELDSKQ